ncbi:MAG TPA: hypothetical protein QGF58_00650 [Myxococcota bacterium]|nr:hypothetical protein [Myxococcota bacterium]
MITAVAKARLRPVVRALLHDLVAEEFGLQFLDEATERLLARIRGMPPHLGGGMAMLTLMWDLSSVAEVGHRAHQLAPSLRRERFASWKTGPVGPCRDWTQFYEKMGVFVFFSTMEDHGQHVEL